MDYVKLFLRLQRQRNLETRVTLLLSSQDNGLRDYYDRMKKNGSTDMDENGMIYVKIHDAGTADRSTWYEEFGHALQFLNNGNVPLGSESPEMTERELEIAECLLANPNRKRKLSNEELSGCMERKNYYLAMYDKG